ncbi:hypothetical protein QN362_04410 [Actimicrobium sp. CCC2.4]|uniref:hypothetical protein n=1 Tax=Actimicrobium sp. CCC2.4 TaxID=3048606 RepID=UPI002AC9BA12|nr:hypothetical protein [Actimicrobium sp. CCC2.4]MEB0134569.1 hypothetical protein [Actimicrobium sp. CCC2.4]WPX34011.1 hypothetical protein RHM62_09490 [Actimicrobium sp. CCC2.4]
MRAFHKQQSCIIASICLTPGKNGKRATQPRCKLFSLNKYTEADALLMAIAWREELVAKLTWPNEGLVENEKQQAKRRYCLVPSSEDR